METCRIGGVHYGYDNRNRPRLSKLGAIAVFVEGRYSVCSMPKTEGSLVTLLQDLSLYNEGIVCYLEEVHSSPQMGVTSSFTFGRGYGLLRGIIQTLGIKLIDVTPQKWMKAIGVTGKKANPDGIYQFVQQTYPNIKCNKSQSDALAILHYAIQQENK